MESINYPTQVLAIDPSLNSMGYAILDMIEDSIIVSGTIKATNKERHEKTEKRITQQLCKLSATLYGELRTGNIAYIIIEQPESWGAYKSMASQKSGDLLGLHILVGSLFWWARTWQLLTHQDRFKNPVHLIKVSKWKGQLQKRHTLKQVKRKYDCNPQTNDESDAIGIASWFITKGGYNVPKSNTQTNDKL